MSDDTFGALAGLLVGGGYEPIPCRGKAPAPDAWQSDPITEARVAEWLEKGAWNEKNQRFSPTRGMNVGLRTQHLAAADFDFYDLDVCRRVVASFKERFGKGLARVGQAPKGLMLYRAAPGKKLLSPAWQSPDGKKHRFELLGEGQQFIAFGIHPDTAQPYRWVDLSPVEVLHRELIEISRDEVAAWIAEELPALIPEDWKPVAHESGPADGGPIDIFDTFRDPHDDVDLETARWMLSELGAEYYDNRASWRDTGFALHHQFGGSLEAFELWDEWSAQSVSYKPGECEGMWESMKDQSDQRRPFTMATLKHWLGDKWQIHRASNQAQVQAERLTTWRERVAAAATEQEIIGEIFAQVRLDDELTDYERRMIAKAAQDRIKRLTGTLPAIKDMRRMVSRPAPQFAEEPGDEFTGPAWARPWVWLMELDKYVHRVTREHASITGFNAAYSRHAADLMVGEEMASPHAMMTTRWRVPVIGRTMFFPRAGDVFEFEGVRYLNLFRRDLIARPGACSKATRDTLDRHFRLLFPNVRERGLVKAFLAHNYLFPGEKVRWAVLIKGCPGDGKTFFAQLMDAVLGVANTRTINATTVMETRYNDWAAGSALASIEEVRLKGHNRHDILNAIKPTITNDRIDWRRMYCPSVAVPNTQNYLLFTNFEDALPIDDTDRRYLILHTPYRNKRDFEEDLDLIYGLSSGQYFRELHEVLKHPDEIAGYLSEVARPAEFDCNGVAPETEARTLTIEAGRSELEDAIPQVLAAGGLYLSPEVLHFTRLKETLRGHGFDDVTDPQLRAVLTSLDYIKCPQRRISVAGERDASGNAPALRLWVRRDLREKALADKAWVHRHLAATDEFAK